MPDAGRDETSASDNGQVLTELLDDLVRSSENGTLSVGNVVSAFEDRSFGALATVIGLIAALPIIGAIPGVSIVAGALILLIAGQYLAGRNHPWVPRFLRDRDVDDKKLEKAVEKAKPTTRWIDKYVKRRLDWLVAGSLQRRIIALAMCVLALAMMPLALVPWGVQPPATAIVFLGVAILGRDGYFAAAGYVLILVTAYVFYAALGSL